MMAGIATWYRRSSLWSELRETKIIAASPTRLGIVNKSPIMLFSQTDRTPGQPRNTFRQPATVSLDPRLTRDVAIKEQVHLQFIWEAFNVLNRANITDLRTTQFFRSTARHRKKAALDQELAG